MARDQRLTRVAAGSAALVLVLALGVVVSTTPPSGAESPSLIHASPPAGSEAAKPAVEPGAGDPNSGTRVAAEAGDPLARALLAIDSSGGYTLQETIQQTFGGQATPEVRIALVQDARGDRETVVLAWGRAAVTDDPALQSARIFAQGGALWFDSGDGWQRVDYTGLPDVYGAFGAYDDWDWLVDAYRDGRVALDAETDDGATRVLTIDRDWLAERVEREGFAVTPVKAVYRVTVEEGANGPRVEAEGRLLFTIGDEELAIATDAQVQSILGQPLAMAPEDLPSR